MNEPAMKNYFEKIKGKYHEFCEDLNEHPEKKWVLIGTLTLISFASTWTVGYSFGFKNGFKSGNEVGKASSCLEQWMNILGGNGMNS